jgi:uncharacterized membrane protein
VTYLLLKWLHIVGAIALVGLHASYGFWIVRGSSHPEALPFTLRNIKWLDERIAFPAYAVILLTGLGMGFLSPPLFTAPWMMSGMILLALLFLVHLLVYRPTVLRMIRLLQSEGIESPSYQAAAGREAKLGIALTIVMVGVVFLMVVKPGLWS